MRGSVEWWGVNWGVGYSDRGFAEWAGFRVDVDSSTTCTEFRISRVVLGFCLALSTGSPIAPVFFAAVLLLTYPRFPQEPWFDVLYLVCVARFFSKGGSIS